VKRSCAAASRLHGKLPQKSQAQGTIAKKVSAEKKKQALFSDGSASDHADQTTDDSDELSLDNLLLLSPLQIYRHHRHQILLTRAASHQVSTGLRHSASELFTIR
jgi:hypothetical protein